jgi:hypothetical protein
MIHGCTPHPGYPKPYVSRAYTTDEGYPVYARQPPRDVNEPLGTDTSQTKTEIMKAWPNMDFDEICRRVVPHSRELLDTPAGYGLVFPAYKMVGAPRPRSAPPGISHASAS